MAVSLRPTLKQEHTDITLSMCVGERPCAQRVPTSLMDRMRDYSRDLYFYTLSTFHEKELMNGTTLDLTTSRKSSKSYKSEDDE